MPREPEKTPEQMLDGLKNYPDIFSNGRIVGKNSILWKKIKKDLNLKMDAQSIYMYLFKDVSACKTNLIKHFRIKSQIHAKKKKKKKDIDYQPLALNLPNPRNLKELNFEVTVPACKIIDFNSDNNKTTDWTHAVRSAIKDVQKLPCAFNFSVGYVSNKSSFSFTGKCGDQTCGSGISGVCHNVMDDTLKINVKTFKTDELIGHTKKIRLSGSLRKEYQKKLIHQTGSEVRDEELSTVTTKFEPASIFNLPTLSKARSEAIDFHIGYSDFKDKSISDQKFQELCNIKILYLKPFNVFYWSKEQVELWNKLRDCWLPLSIDDTGGIVKKFIYNSVKSKTIFYYVLVIGFGKIIYPLCQALCSSNHVFNIEELLNRWLESGAKVPREIVSDGSVVLQNAICLSFNNMTFSQYNLQCFLYLKKKVEFLPKCYYRSDVAHLLNAVKHWNCFKNVLKSTKNFYLRIIGLLTQTEDLSQFKNIVQSTVVISSTEFAETGSLCLKLTNDLFELFKTFTKVLDDLSISEKKPIDESEKQKSKLKKKDQNEDSISNELKFYVDSIFIISDNELKLTVSPNKQPQHLGSEKDESKKEASGKKDILTFDINPFYCPTFVKEFQRLCYSFPSWTNLLREAFGSPNIKASSNRNETYFGIRKKSLKNPKKVEKFLLVDNKYVKAKTNHGLIMAERLQYMLEQEETIEVKDLANALSIQQENIIINKNFGNISKLSNSEATLDQCFDWSTISVSSPKIMTKNKRKLVLNGLNVDDSYKINFSNANKICKFIETCPFDSIFEMITTMILDYKIFQEEKSDDFNFITIAKNYIKNGFLLNTLYQERARILFTMYSADLETREIEPGVINCRANAGRVLKNFMKNIPSRTNIISCSCGYYNILENVITDIRVQDFFSYSLKNLKLLMEEEFKVKIQVCPNCSHKSAENTSIIGEYLAIDVEIFYQKENLSLFTRSCGDDIQCKKSNLDELPRNLHLQNKSYQLSGAICFSGCEGEVPHYKSFTLSKNGSWILYDGLLHSVKTINRLAEQKIGLIFYSTTNCCE